MSRRTREEQLRRLWDTKMDFKLFINNEWAEGNSGRRLDVEDPATREIIASVVRGDAADVDRAVRAARGAFEGWAALAPAERAGYLRKLAGVIERRSDEFCDIITRELGMPRRSVYDNQVAPAISDATIAADIAEVYEYEKRFDTYIERREPFGVVGGITPWNYPLLQATTKLFAAMAAGNTTVLKPSKSAPLSCLKLAECVLEAGFPPGVFNVVTGAGGEVGNAMAVHKDIDALSFTGSTKAGIEVGRLALSTVKKITLELGGKSPLILLPDGDAAAAVAHVCGDVFINCGQTCSAFTRFIVPQDRLGEVKQLLRAEAAKYVPGDPWDEGTMIGPLISRSAFDKVKSYIQSGIDEGAELLTGEVPGEPETGYFVKPAVFTDVRPDMKIARDEIFGPVISVITYETVDEAVRIANDTDYGLAGCVFGSEESAMPVLRKIKAGYLLFNGNIPAGDAAFGGYKASGIGREYGLHGFEEFLEVKVIGV